MLPENVSPIDFMLDVQIFCSSLDHFRDTPQEKNNLVNQIFAYLNANRVFLASADPTITKSIEYLAGKIQQTCPEHKQLAKELQRIANRSLGFAAAQAPQADDEAEPMEFEEVLDYSKRYSDQEKAKLINAAVSEGMLKLDKRELRQWLQTAGHQVQYLRLDEIISEEQELSAHEIFSYAKLCPNFEEITFYPGKDISKKILRTWLETIKHPEGYWVGQKKIIELFQKRISEFNVGDLPFLRAFRLEVERDPQLSFVVQNTIDSINLMDKKASLLLDLPDEVRLLITDRVNPFNLHGVNYLLTNEARSNLINAAINEQFRLSLTPLQLIALLEACGPNVVRLNLKYLLVEGTRVNEAEMMRIIQLCPNLTMIHFNLPENEDNEDIFTAYVGNMLGKCRNLKNVTIDTFSDSADSVLFLENLMDETNSLQSLSLGLNVNESHLKAIAEAEKSKRGNPNRLTALHLNNAYYLDNDAIGLLASCAKLKTLSITNDSAGAPLHILTEGIKQALKGLKHLEYLDLGGQYHVDDTLFDDLKLLPSTLKLINLNATDVTQEAIKNLRNKRPKLKAFNF